jgi:hypothetical protein
MYSSSEREIQAWCALRGWLHTACTYTRPTAAPQYLSRRTKQGQWLASVVGGHLASYAVPDNTDAMRAFRDQAASTEAANTPGLSSASTPASKGGDQCARRARWIHAGPSATAVPTPTRAPRRRVTPSDN